MQNLDNVVHICYEQIQCAEATVVDRQQPVSNVNPFIDQYN